jgi:peptidoglycan/LPS O-acetylase OafA/YrhL
VRTLLVPFLIWSGLGVLFAIAVSYSPFRDVSPYWTISSPAEALDRWLLHPVIYPLWFLQALMTCMVLSPLVYLLVRLLRGWALLVAALWWVLGWQPDALFPWISATAFPPFIAGATIALRGWRSPWATRPRPGSRVLQGSRGAAPATAPAAVPGPAAATVPAAAAAAPPWLAWVIIAAWLAAGALYAAFGHALGDWTRAALLPVVVLGILALWTGFDALKGLLRPSAGLVAAGLAVAPLSFFVYVTQEPMLSALTDLLERLGPPPFLAYIVPPLVTIAVSVAAALLVRRVLPHVYAVLSGGRGPRRRPADGRRDETPGQAKQAPAETPAPASAE